ncbi:hypothetical protein [uncultured Reyranella sp.]|nr:hypothetical protein [uncultured Reyranella sp.]
MTDIPIYLLLLACGSFMLLSISVASATAQYLRSQPAIAVAVVKQQPVNR